MLKRFRIPLIINAVALIVAFLIWGLSGAITVAILTVLELSFSFDNAVVNAKILERMNLKWQKLFLTVGILIAVFGMRLIFPLVVVALAASISPIAALTMALQHPHMYAQALQGAHEAIAVFGGVFLFMLFIDWLVEEREVHWLSPFEEILAEAGKIENITAIITGLILILLATYMDHPALILFTGLSSMLLYMGVKSLDTLFSEDKAAGMAKDAAKAGFTTFLYLELIDASFSFDGVVGAFAVSTNVFLIATGLGIGAIYVRGLTVYLVERGTLAEYKYLEHGAHWAIGALALMLLASTQIKIPETVAGLLGVGFIVVALAHSIVEKEKSP